MRMSPSVNARDAMPGGGALRISARRECESSQAGRRTCWAWLAVEDDGPGMDEEVQRQVFEPFFTTKGEGGTGLGLAVVHGIVQQLHGSIEIDSAPGEGTCVRIRLPLVEVSGGAAVGASAGGGRLEECREPLGVAVSADATASATGT